MFAQYFSTTTTVAALIFAPVAGKSVRKENPTHVHDIVWVLSWQDNTNYRICHLCVLTAHKSWVDILKFEKACSNFETCVRFSTHPPPISPSPALSNTVTTPPPRLEVVSLCRTLVFYSPRQMRSGKQWTAMESVIACHSFVRA